MWPGRACLEFASEEGLSPNGSSSATKSSVDVLLACPTIQARKRNPNPNFLVRISSWDGGLPREGWGPKSWVCPSKPGKSNFFGGISRGFARISRRCPKGLRNKKKVRVQFSSPNHTHRGFAKGWFTSSCFENSVPGQKGCDFLDLLESQFQASDPNREK